MKDETNSARKKAMEVLLAKIEAPNITPDVAMFYNFGNDWLDCFDAYNGSLDAAKALHEAVVPGWKVTYLGQQEDGWMVVLARVGPLTGFDGKHPNNPARSWLIAILKVLIERLHHER